MAETKTKPVKRHPSGLDRASRAKVLETVEEFEGRQWREKTLSEHLHTVFGAEDDETEDAG